MTVLPMVKEGAVDPESSRVGSSLSASEPRAVNPKQELNAPGGTQ